MSAIDPHMPPAAPRSFLSNARWISLITFLSRLLGMLREILAASYFGAGAVWSAFQYAFTIPNLFRKLLGEGALAAAFIPLYTQSLRDSPDRQTANDFASASVSLLITWLIGITIIGEILLLVILWQFNLLPNTRFALHLTIIMLPYVIFICGTAFLSGILQVHGRFILPAATSIISNLLMIIALVGVALKYNLKDAAHQRQAVVWVAVAVLISGVAQLLMLIAPLRATGFRYRFIAHCYTPAIIRMLRLSIPVALGAGVLQLGVVLDKQLALSLSVDGDHTHFTLFGHIIALPMQAGALARLNWAQFLYQFPLGVFAIALATAIFPQLSGDALDVDRTRFRNVLRKGIEAALFIGLPASAGMMLVAQPAVRLLFERGQFTANDSHLTALSTALYASAIWAFSILQILNRAFYALHDMRTPLIWAAINLLINLIVEIPLLWTPLGESAMAVGTLISFIIQAGFMLWILHRRLGSLGLHESLKPVGKMVLATALMVGVCLILRHSPLYPAETMFRPKVRQLIQLFVLMTTGGAVYFIACRLMGMNVLDALRRRRPTSSASIP